MKKEEIRVVSSDRGDITYLFIPIIPNSSMILLQDLCQTGKNGKKHWKGIDFFVYEDYNGQSIYIIKFANHQCFETEEP